MPDVVLEKMKNALPLSRPESPKNQESNQIIASYSGPIPPPHFLIQYEQIVPGIAKRFLEEPHLEAEHRRSLQKTIAQEQIKLYRT